MASSRWIIGGFLSALYALLLFKGQRVEAFQGASPAEINEMAGRAYDRGRYRLAIRFCTLARTRGDNGAEPYILQSAALRRLGRHEEAMDMLDRAVAADPRDAEARLNRRALRVLSRKLEGSIEDFTEAIAVSSQASTTSWAYYNRGRAKLEQGNRRAAAEDWERFLDLNSDSPLKDALRREIESLRKE